MNDEWVLSQKALSDLIATLSTYGSSLSPSAHTAISAVLATMESGLRGSLPPSYYLSAIDPGTGKSLAVALFLKAYKDAGFLPAGGVLVCVSRLDEIDTYLRNAGLAQDEVAVLTGDEERNDLGAPIERHDQAPVMFITQQRLEAKRGKQAMKDLSELFYQGHPRSLRIWDESATLGQPSAPQVDSLGTLLGPLRRPKPQMAADVQRVMMDAWQAEPGSVITIPESLAPPAKVDLHLEDTRRGLAVLAGGGVRVVDVKGDRRLAGAGRSLPDDFAPAVILDASGRVRTTYRLWADNAGGLVRLPAAANDYRDMQLYVWDRSAGKQTLSTSTALDDIAQAVSEKVMERPDEQWLVVHYKDAKQLLGHIHGRLDGEIAGRVHGLTWGQHHGTNAFAHVPNVVIVGYMNYGVAGYEALASAAIGGGAVLEMSDQEKAALQDGETAHQFLQAVCRSRARQARDGVAGACRVYLCTTRSPRLDAILDSCFPGHRRGDWVPSNRVRLKGRKGQVIEYLEGRFGTSRGVVVTKQEVGEALGIRTQNLTQYLAHPQVQDALWEMDIEVDLRSFKRPADTFGPYDGGGFIGEDLGR